MEIIAAYDWKPFQSFFYIGMSIGFAFKAII
jgi:hypothetical protein